MCVCGGSPCRVAANVLDFDTNRLFAFTFEAIHSGKL